MRSPVFALVLSLCWVLCPRASVGLQSDVSVTTPSVVHKWVSVALEWPSEATKQEYVNESLYIAENNIIAGIKVWQQRVFVTVPRWRRGVPVNLAEVVSDSNGNPLLRAWPNWHWQQQLDNCSKLQFAQSMEIDPLGRMWLLDTGVKYHYSSAAVDYKCPPKLLLFNVSTGEQLAMYTFPEPVVNYSSVFLNDIVVDTVNDTVYISDLKGALPGALVVYSHRTKHSFRVEHTSMAMDCAQCSARIVAVNEYKWYTSVAIDGIALTPDLHYVYYCPLSSRKTWRVRVSTLFARATMEESTQLFDRDVEFVGLRNSQMDGMTFSNDSRLYFGGLSQNALVEWVNAYDSNGNLVMVNSSAAEVNILYSDDSTMQWLDTLAWDSKGYVWFVTNRLHRYSTDTMDWSGAEGANFRVLKMYTGRSSYMQYAYDNFKQGNGDDDNGGHKKRRRHRRTTTLWLVFTLVPMACIIFGGREYCKYRREKSTLKIKSLPTLALDWQTAHSVQMDYVRMPRAKPSATIVVDYDYDDDA